MYVASIPASARRRREPLARRTIAFMVVLAVHILLVGLLILLAPQPPGKSSSAKVFELRELPLPPAPPAPPAPRAKAPARKVSPRPPAKPAAAPPPRAKPAATPFGTELFEAVDIAKLPNHRAELNAAAENAAAGTAGEAPSTGQDSVAVGGPGGGPNGETLYRAEWYTEPTHAELAFYLPKNVPQDSWGMIACKTIARNRVDDCVELGESPPGSRLSGGIRQAAWQFRVLPPRINGRPVIGAWVRIRIDFTERAEPK